MVCPNLQSSRFNVVVKVRLPDSQLGASFAFSAQKPQDVLHPVSVAIWIQTRRAIPERQVFDKASMANPAVDLPLPGRTVDGIQTNPPCVGLTVGLHALDPIGPSGFRPAFSAVDRVGDGLGLPWDLRHRGNGEYAQPKQVLHEGVRSQTM